VPCSRTNLPLTCAVGLLGAACAPSPPAPTTDVAPTIDALVASVHGYDDEAIGGRIALDARGDDVRVTTRLEGLSGGAHAYHVHEYGDCSAPGRAGEPFPFDTAATMHALSETVGEPPDQPEPAVVGNLGELVADEAGVASVEIVVQDLRPAWLPDLRGRAIVVHADGNEPGTTSGDAGDAIACGVLGLADGR